MVAVDHFAVWSFISAAWEREREKVKTGEKETLSSLTELLTSEEACNRPVCTKTPFISAPMKLMSLIPHHITLLSYSTNLFTCYFTWVTSAVLHVNSFYFRIQHHVSFYSVISLQYNKVKYCLWNGWIYPTLKQCITHLPVWDHWQVLFVPALSSVNISEIWLKG